MPLKHEKTSLIGEIAIGILNVATHEAKTYQAEHECQVHGDERACKQVQTYHNMARDAAMQLGRSLQSVIR